MAGRSTALPMRLRHIATAVPRRHLPPHRAAATTATTDSMLPLHLPCSSPLIAVSCSSFHPAALPLRSARLFSTATALSPQSGWLLARPRAPPTLHRRQSAAASRMLGSSVPAAHNHAHGEGGCWQCGRDTAEAVGSFCDKCGNLQPPPKDITLFEVFGWLVWSPMLPAGTPPSPLSTHSMDPPQHTTGCTGSPAMTSTGRRSKRPSSSCRSSCTQTSSPWRRRLVASPHPSTSLERTVTHHLRFVALSLFLHSIFPPGGEGLFAGALGARQQGLHHPQGPPAARLLHGKRSSHFGKHRKFHPLTLIPFPPS